ncbi:MipA/OmpV family protein (plasmid) [Tistrella mobilis]|uniref:MipA/OmpV family protein n=1 Tax=Tistrella mobilis TaxID=171437 RepID=UPI0035567E7D
MRRLACHTTSLLPAAAAVALLIIRPAGAEARDWSLVLGAGAELAPEYEGGEDMEVSPVPLVLFTWQDWLTVSPGGAEARVARWGQLSVSGRLGYEGGRDQDDADRLKGLGDVDGAATAGLKLAWNPEPFEVYLTVDRALGGNDGLTGTLGLDYTMEVSERLTLTAGVAAVMADDKHMQSYFGIDARQSTASGLARYDAEAGLKRVEFETTATWMMGGNWLLRGAAGVGVLTGDAADSPVVEEKVQPKLSLALGYRF